MQVSVSSTSVFIYAIGSIFFMQVHFISEYASVFYASEFYLNWGYFIYISSSVNEVFFTLQGSVAMLILLWE